MFCLKLAMNDFKVLFSHQHTNQRDVVIFSTLTIVVDLTVAGRVSWGEKELADNPVALRTSQENLSLELGLLRSSKNHPTSHVLSSTHSLLNGQKAQCSR